VRCCEVKSEGWRLRLPGRVRRHPARFIQLMLTFPALGFGLGLRVSHYEAILATQPAVDWFEVLTENYLVPGGRPLDYLTRIRERYPLAMHGVSLSIGSSAPLDREYLR